jgi:tetratricopeptide (TPR) repeat protein
MTETPTTPGADQVEVDEERWYLNDQREFLVRSIADARAEHEAGDLNNEDFSLLVRRDQRKLAEVEAELERLGPLLREPDDALTTMTAPSSPDSPEIPSRRRRWRIAGMVTCSALIVLGVVLLLVQAVNPRLPGQSTSGGVTQTQAQLIEEQLAQASTLDNSGQLAASLKVYDKVLSEDPNNPRALAESGWVEWSAGASDNSPKVESVGQKAVEKSIRLSPTFYEGPLFLGLILYNQYDNAPAAVMQFNKFLADDPPAVEVTAAASKMAGAYQAAGVPVPSALTTPSG